MRAGRGSGLCVEPDSQQVERPCPSHCSVSLRMSPRLSVRRPRQPFTSLPWRTKIRDHVLKRCKNVNDCSHSLKKSMPARQLAVVNKCGYAEKCCEQTFQENHMKQRLSDIVHFQKELQINVIRHPADQTQDQVRPLR